MNQAPLKVKKGKKEVVIVVIDAASMGILFVKLY